MRTPICNILLILLLLQAAAHHGFSAEEIEKIPFAKAFATFAPLPQYPAKSRAQRQTGSGVAILVLDPNTGVVKTAQMAVSTGYELLDDYALKAFRVWRFRPGSPAKVRIPVSFIMPGGRVVTEVKVMKNPDMEEILAPFLGKGTVVRGPKPRYPLDPPWTDKQGKGTYELHVGKDGKVEEVKILKTSGDATFDRVVVSTLGKWQLRKGPMVVELPLAFKLTPRSYDLWIP
jgi:TonB family protein